MKTITEYAFTHADGTHDVTKIVRAGLFGWKKRKIVEHYVHGDLKWVAVLDGERTLSFFKDL